MSIFPSEAVQKLRKMKETDIKDLFGLKHDIHGSLITMGNQFICFLELLAVLVKNYIVVLITGLLRLMMVGGSVVAVPQCCYVIDS